MSFKKPNFFILGAPKCGTTSLAYWLSQHPNIYMSPIKEPHHFNRDGLQSIEDRTEYEELFEQAEPEQHKAVGEASTHYLYSKKAVPNILEYNPNAKFLVCLRNPIEMVQALHAERLKQGRETIKSFKKAWYAQEERRKGINIPSTAKVDPDRLQYGLYCKLGDQLDQLEKKVNNGSQVHVVVLDDMKQDPEKEYKSILSFLGLEEIIRTKFPVLNKSTITINPFFNKLARDISNIKEALQIPYSFGVANLIKKINTKKEKRASISMQMNNKLKNYFQDDIKLLERILERDLGYWLE